MSTQILIKRSTTTGAVPTTSDIAVGELAINTVDKRIFTNNSGTIVELGTTPTTQAVTGNASVGGTFDVVGAVTVGNFTADGTVDLTSATVTIPAPTADTHPATKKYVDDEVNAILAGAPAALDTLNEIAAAINDDANVYTTLTNSIATKLSLSGGTMTGSIDMGANSVTTSADPATANTLTRKSYVDGLYQSTVDAEVSAAAALASEQAAATSASNAASSASASATSASASASSATNSASSATAAASSATSASNSATASATSATQSAASATQAQTLVDSIESFYLGAEASAPTVDDNGDPLQAGDWYFNTTDSQTYIYNGSSWQSVSPDVVADLTPQLGGNLDTNGNDVLFGDNDKAIFGSGSDLQIYHSGAHSYIDEQGQGNLYISGSSSVNIRRNDTSALMASFENGVANLYWDGAKKLTTTSTGIDVTGTATMDGLTVDGDVTFGSGSEELFLFTGGAANSQIKIRDNNALEIKAGTEGSESNRLKIANNGDISFYEDTGTTAKFFWDASAERLGIGTSSPSGALEVVGGASLGSGFTQTRSGHPSFGITNGGTDSIYFSLAPDGGSHQTFMQVRDDDVDVSSIAFSTSGTERMRIDSSGNVKIGTTSGGGKLNVTSDIQTSLQLENTAYTTKFAIDHPSGGSVDIQTYTGGAWTVPMSFKSGNVGIGTSSPSNKLTTYGNVSGGWIAVLENTHSSNGFGLKVKAGDDSAVDSFRVTDYNNTSLLRVKGNGDLSFDSGYGSAATAYGCRAWVNFRGDGTVYIRDSGNISSLTDNGTANYTIAFTTAMPDNNYAAQYTVGGTSGSSGDDSYGAFDVNSGQATSSNLRLRSTHHSGTKYDTVWNCVTIFR
jgi:hypothetical protein